MNYEFKRIWPNLYVGVRRQATGLLDLVHIDVFSPINLTVINDFDTSLSL